MGDTSESPATEVHANDLLSCAGTVGLNEEACGDTKLLEGPYEASCFNAAEVKRTFGIDAQYHTWVEISCDKHQHLFDLTLAHIGKHGTCGGSFTPQIKSQDEDLDDDSLRRRHLPFMPSSRNDFGIQKKCNAKVVTLSAGLGYTEVEHTNKTGSKCVIKTLHLRRGPVIGTNYRATTWETLVLFIVGRDSSARESLSHFVESIINNETEPRPNQYKIFRYSLDMQSWMSAATKTSRTIESVVLPTSTKDKIIEDLDAFLNKEACDFYTSHGIPYKRSYLFYGVPGAGKTSLLTALAGKYSRNLCILQPTDHRFTDHALSEAIRQAPANSILVLEDVDALFGRDREASSGKAPLTFSGLLNALDGIGNPDGQIFVLTTNHRERLDPALIRNGRVDMHVEFSHANSEQMEMIFQQFYPKDASDLSATFRRQVLEALGDKQINMAALQHFFIRSMRKSAADAIAAVPTIVDDYNEKRLASQARSDNLYL